MAFTPFTEADQPTMAAFNEKFQSAINDAVGNGLQFKVGTYIGTGTSGSGGKSSLSFPSPPILVFISGPGYESDSFTTATLIRSVKKLTSDGDYPNYGFYFTSISWSGNSVSWYGSSALFQANKSGETYYYAAILEGGDT